MKNSTKLKIALVLDDSIDRINNGVQQYVLTLGSWLVKNGHSVHYLVGESKPTKTTFSMSRNVAVRFNKNRLTIPLPANKLNIRKHLETNKYDILHVQMPYNPFMSGRLVSAIDDSVGVVGTFHILPYGKMQKYSNKALAVAQKASLRRYDAICSVSPAASEFAKSHYGITSLVIPNMIESSQWKSKAQILPGRIVFLGRLVPRKGCMELLKAINLLPNSIKNTLEIIIAGDGPQKGKLQKYVKKHKLINVHFLGFIDESRKAGLLASAEIAVFPSLGGESFGIVLIEAISAGAGVVIGGNNAGYASVLGDIPQTMFDPKDTQQFSETLYKFLTDNNTAHMVHKNQAIGVKKFYVDTAGPKILELYNKALLHSRKDVR